jgi:UDP:flavonoid glycosyltransferase YjiC (YdhE family)
MLAHPPLTGLAEAVRDVLDEPGYRAAAWRVAAEIEALPSVDTAPAVLEAIAQGGTAG